MSTSGATILPPISSKMPDCARTLGSMFASVPMTHGCLSCATSAASSSSNCLFSADNPSPSLRYSEISTMPPQIDVFAKAARWGALGRRRPGASWTEKQLRTNTAAPPLLPLCLPFLAGVAEINHELRAAAPGSAS